MATTTAPVDEKTASQSPTLDSAHTLAGDKQHNVTEQYAADKSSSEADTGEALQQIKTSEEGAEYPTGLKLGLISLALCLAVFLIALDNTIIATAIPKITDEFHSLPDVGWYASAYLLTTAAFQLLFGKFYSFYSIKVVFLTAIVIFEIGSLICGVAPNSVALIVGRAIAGLGSAGVFSGALIIIAYSVPLEKRPIYTGLTGAMYGLASVVGPLLGGVFTDKVTWRWCFYINLPIGAVTLVVIFFFFTAPTRAAVAELTWKEKVGQLDLLGTLFFLPAIICVLLALQWGGSKYAWSDGRIIALLVLFVVFLLIFMGIQYYKGDYATVPFRIIKKRSIWAGGFFSFCLGAAFFIEVYYIPIWFQAIKGSTAVESGIRSLPLILGLVIISILSGVGVTLFGYYTPWVIGSTVIMSVGMGLICTWEPDTPSAKWIGFQALAGIGVGMGMQQTLIAVQTVLDISDVPVGTALIIFLQILGGALFVSVGQNIFDNKLVQGLAAQLPGFDPNRILQGGATSLPQNASPEQLPIVIQVYNDALVAAFTAAAAVAAISIIGSASLEWKSVKGKKVEMAMA